MGGYWLARSSENDQGKGIDAVLLREGGDVWLPGLYEPSDPVH